MLDINDYNDNFGDSTGRHSHGEEWERVGPAVLLGYNYSAPGDDGGATSRIIASWKENRALGDVEAWMAANKANKAWNACAIVKDAKYVYFEKLPFGLHIKKEVNKENW